MPEINLSYLPGDVVFTVDENSGMITRATVARVDITEEYVHFYLDGGSGPWEGEELCASAAAAGRVLDGILEHRAGVAKKENPSHATH